MPKVAKELSDAQVRRLKWKPNGKPAYHAVGGVPGLLLQCRKPVAGSDIGARSWILRTVVGNKRKDIGLGGYPAVSLSKARDKAREKREQIEKGIDPTAERKKIKSALIREQAKQTTFRQVAQKYVAKKTKEFKTAKQAQKLSSHLRDYAYPYIGDMVVGDVERAHIFAMLDPIWEEKNETAARVRAAVERILDLAGVEGLRTGDNPARWKGNLELSLVKPQKAARTQSRPALDYNEMQEFWARLSGHKSTAAKALQFQILTAARPGEARQARWADIDLGAKVWTVPGEMMKGGRAHRVPLCNAAVKLLKSLPQEGEYLFPSRSGKPITDVMPTKIIQTLHDEKVEADGVGYVDHKQGGARITAHGFRSTLRTWSQEHTTHREEVLELALAHVATDATRAAYARSELIEDRRKLMRQWEQFCLHGLPKRKRKVVSLKEARA